MNISPIPFFIFGAGPRKKVIYRGGTFMTWPDMKHFFKGEPIRELIDPEAYRVHLECKDGRKVDVYEDETGIWVEEDGMAHCLSSGDLRLPTFENHPYKRQLRIAHHEMLVNIYKGQPLPNMFAYKKPWYRTAAMIAMALEKTGNLAAIRDWILSLGQCFDRNNAGNDEPDNIGQVLYLLSLVSDKYHPVVEAILGELRDTVTDGHVSGMTDFAEHSVYQTSWVKFGLERLGLPDYLQIPEKPDSYAQLCWWYGRNPSAIHSKSRHENNRMRPQLAWAEAHYRASEPPIDLSGLTYPLTWEANAMQADYSGMNVIDPSFARNRIVAPNTWHSAELFLYLIDKDKE